MGKKKRIVHHLQWHYRAVLGGVLGPSSIGEKVIAAYEKHLFEDATLQALPNYPLFVINATNIQSGVLWRFTKPFMGDYRVGIIKKPTVSLAFAVAASSAFPPFLAPHYLEVDPADFEVDSGTDLQRVPFTSDIYLNDGGVYDNLGLETVWKRYETVLVSDAGGQFSAEEEPKTDWPRHTYRTINLIDNQVRSLRKRQLIRSFELRRDAINNGLDPDSDLFKKSTRYGAYWGVRTNIDDYGLESSLECPYENTLELAKVATRLKRLDSDTQMKLINWGYAVSDAALRKYVDSQITKPSGFPYPEIGV